MHQIGSAISLVKTVPGALLALEAAYVTLTLTEWKLRSKVYWGGQNRTSLGLFILAVFSVSTALKV